ncbi:Com family DNA-binding transcriptional regulator [Pasteurella multocida]
MCHPPCARRMDFSKLITEMVINMQKSQEYRCKCCKKLLARAKDVQKLEIKCVRCKTINQFN